MVGSKVIIYARELDIVDYGDVHTRQILQHQTQQASVILPAATYTQWGMILSSLESNGLTAVKVKTVLMADNLIDQLSEALQDSKISDILPSNTIALVLLLQGEECITKLQALCVQIYKDWGAELLPTASDRQNATVVATIFSTSRGSTATFDSCTCCIIKPHAVKDKLTGSVLDMIISAGFEVSAAESLFFDRSKADEFLEVYKGVIPDYGDQALQLSSGLCIALELRGQDAVYMLRQLAGPWDVNIAKELFPNSIRGKYGLDALRSVVHCTDLEEDAKLETQYCFRIML